MRIELIKNKKKNFFIFIFIVKNSTPSEPNWQKLWEEKLKNYECSSGQYVCIEHFTSDDYRLTNHGTRIVLNQNAIPTIFNELIEIEVCENENQDEDITPMALENQKLHEKIKEIESKFQNYKIIMDARIKKSASDIHELRKQLAASKLEINKLVQTITDLNEENRILDENVSLQCNCT